MKTKKIIINITIFFIVAIFDISASKTLKIPRTTVPWQEATLIVGDGKTLHSDFSLTKGNDGKWHCIGTFGLEPGETGNGWLESDGYDLFHSSGYELTEPMDVMPKIGHQYNQETAIMWAPGVIWNKDRTLAFLYYFHNYPNLQERDRVCARLLVTNDADMKNWRPYDGGDLPETNMVFREQDDRDFCVFWDDRVGKYLMYYCSSLAAGPRVRTSEDLIHWSEPKTVLSAPAGDPHGYAESPFVLYRDGYYYLWVSGIDYSKVALYISENPFDFGDAIANKIEYTPGHAPEIVTENGVDYMACSMVSTFPSTYPAEHDLEGIYIQPLKWEEADESAYSKVTRLPASIPAVDEKTQEWEFLTDLEGWSGYPGRDVEITQENGALKMEYKDIATASDQVRLWYPEVYNNAVSFDVNEFPFMEIHYDAVGWPTDELVQMFVGVTKTDGTFVYSLVNVDPKKEMVSIDLSSFVKGITTVKAITFTLPYDGDPSAVDASVWFGAETLIDKIILTNIQNGTVDFATEWDFDFDNEGWLPVDKMSDFDMTYGIGCIKMRYYDKGQGNGKLFKPSIEKKNVSIDADNLTVFDITYESNMVLASNAIPSKLSYKTKDGMIGSIAFDLPLDENHIMVKLNEKNEGASWGGEVVELQLELPVAELANAEEWYDKAEIKLNGLAFKEDGTSVVDMNDIGTVRIYPNPASEKVYFDGLEGEAVVTMYDSCGIMIKSLTLDSNCLSVEDLSSGLYFLSVNQENKKQLIKLIVK